MPPRVPRIDGNESSGGGGGGGSPLVAVGLDEFTTGATDVESSPHSSVEEAFSGGLSLRPNSVTSTDRSTGVDTMSLSYKNAASSGEQHWNAQTAMGLPELTGLGVEIAKFDSNENSRQHIN